MRQSSVREASNESFESDSSTDRARRALRSRSRTRLQVALDEAKHNNMM